MKTKLLTALVLLSMHVSAMTVNNRSIDGHWFECQGAKVVNEEEVQSFEKGLCRTNANTIEVSTEEDFETNTLFLIDSLYTENGERSKQNTNISAPFIFMASEPSETVAYYFFPYAFCNIVTRDMCQ